MVKYLKPNNLDINDEIVEAEIRQCWIGNDKIAKFGSLFTKALTGMAVTHWWVKIKTLKGYYCAQFNHHDYLALTFHTSSE